MSNTRDGFVLCVDGVAVGDVLALLDGPSPDAAVVASIRADSCAIRSVGVTDGSWTRISVFAAVLEPMELRWANGWAQSAFLAPADQIDSPESAALRSDNFVPTVEAPGQSPCSEVGGTTTCDVSNWLWRPADSPCSGGVDGWHSDAGGSVIVDLVDGRWEIVERLVLAVMC